MKQEQPPIFVNFCAYLPYDDIPSVCINLGKINTAQLNRLLNAFARPPRPNACIKTMNIEFNDNMSFGNLPGLGKRYRTLNLSNMFYFYDVKDTKAHAPCMAGKRQPKTEESMIRACAHNLRCGKCRDEFIRRTLGAALFPALYAKDKQK